jgi:hypothetical protein
MKVSGRLAGTMDMLFTSPAVARLLYMFYSAEFHT